MAGKVTLGEVKRCEISLAELIKINRLLDAQAAAEKEALK